MNSHFEIIDGNTACAKIAYLCTEYASIYPITPSTAMAELYETQSSNKIKNIFNTIPICEQMHSEAGVAGALHGALCAGALSTTFTCSQGLLLMIPNLYKISAEMLPCVIHVSARALSTHALNIFGDHQDVYACYQTGFAIICSNNPQECADLALISHATTYKTQVPIIHFFDGFRTSHEIQKVNNLTNNEIKQFMPRNDIISFKNRRISCSNPQMRGTAQNSDIYYQGLIRTEAEKSKFAIELERKMVEFEKKFHRTYHAYEYIGNPNAKYAIVIMGSASQTLIEAQSFNDDIGIIIVRLFAPFNNDLFINCIPKTIKRICVLERAKIAEDSGNILYQNVVSALYNKRKDIEIYCGSYGLGGKDFNFSMADAVMKNIKLTNAKNFFNVGIIDDINYTSLPIEEKNYNPHFNMMLFGIGSDGTVSASKNTAKVIGKNSSNYIQGYFEYDSKKSGGLTISHIRIGKEEIKSTYKIEKANLICVNNFDCVNLLHLEEYLAKNSTLILNIPLNPDEEKIILPKELTSKIINDNITVYSIQAYEIAKNIGLNNKINTIMQGALFKVLSEINNSNLFTECQKEIKKTYTPFSKEIMQKNLKGFEIGFNFIKQIKITHKNEAQNSVNKSQDFYKMQLSRKGDSIPVSQFDACGILPTNTSHLDTRSISNYAPKFIKENCIQCNKCAISCPHSIILPKLITEERAKELGLSIIPSNRYKQYGYTLCIDTKHCTGCGVCVNVCPAKQKALLLDNKCNLTEQNLQSDLLKTIENPTKELNKLNNNELAFFEPYFKNCGACAGCGESVYIKLLSQLFGNNLIIANATGCSSIYCGSAPFSPFTIDKNGRGISWASSLFEDNAEFAFGIKTGKDINKDNEIIFAIGGDGWAYDIGYGGLDHILHSGKNINILVLDSELYSNTGGQCSKSTPQGASGTFITNGKKHSKKQLGLHALQLKDVFVAQVSLGANTSHCINALKEAVAYPGVSLIIAYCPCINHGFDMSYSNQIMKEAVSCGIWQLFTYNPSKQDNKLNMFELNKTPLSNFLSTQKRFKNISDIDIDNIQKDIEHNKKILNFYFKMYTKITD